ncbi:EthD family reductase [Flavobacteriaceae bacterium S0825]|uniref:EthD family reductase n=1 Tax=Gaetbulibacter sp. S0825 TaxID=2720084 RepID=UPI001430AA52|nr:EthD family reductase [Gaetbulibacter sp. S0825]MCK0108959.1 EthD family reductase [Flavobacteriaceae bacterium S0825]NIX64594.1 EthD family reductase [Gaetbulibacter sp. S0825]
MQKLTVLYKHPTNPEAFEKYYKEKHLPLAATMEGVAKIEITKLHGTPDGQKADYYRMAELYFSSVEQMQETMSSPEGQATVDDLSNFATGGVSVIVGFIENDI